jgi:3-hydroxyacyl-CoA dehydrogenase/3a,7a,12a-trihydroxy-5b-cholest-24-enoyl-CoA hydratase
MQGKQEIRFDGKVVVVTGAGIGLGRAYALLFAKRGAKVVVNDLGTSHTGTGTASSAADSVVNEIKASGGVAVANYDSVEFGEKIVKTAIDNFGRIDVLINNAGILRDRAFKKMTRDDWDLIVKVHLNGIYATSRAAYDHMVAQKFGRIINVASPSGLYGAYGQVNYSMAKAGVIGFTKALSKEGQKSNVLSNVIAPIAATRMTETVLSKDILEKLKPEYIVPLVAFLSHESCQESGSVFELGARWISKLRWQRSEGEFFGDNFTPEDVKDKFESISNFEKNSTYPDDTTSSLSIMMENIERSITQNKTTNKTLKSDDVFNLIRNYLASCEGKELVKKVACVFQIDIIETKGGPVVKSWSVDLKNESGSAKEGKAEKPDVVFTVSDEDFYQICSGKLNPQMAVVQVI